MSSVANGALCVVTMGHGSEYPFGPLVSALRAHGFDCVELDMNTPRWRQALADALGRPRRVLLCAQHPTLDRYRFERHYGFAADVVSLSGAIDLVRPERAYFVPHDLAMPIYGEEAATLREVDGALMPDDRFWYLNRFTKVHDVGWIKAVTPAQSVELPKADWVFLPSDVGAWSRRPTEDFVAIFEPVLKYRFPFKLPSFPGLGGLRASLIEAGCPEIPSETSSCEVIGQYAGTISMGPSSVLVEAAWMGRAGLCVAEGAADRKLIDEALGCHADITVVEPNFLEAELMRPPHRTARAEIGCKLNLERVIAILRGA